MRAWGILAVCVAFGACSGSPPLTPFPFESLDAEGRDVVVVYFPGNAPPALAWVSGRLVSAEEEGLYLWDTFGPVHLKWAAVRAVSAVDPDRPYLRPDVRATGFNPQVPNPRDLARATRVVDRATPDDQRRLARLSRFPAGRPPAWRSLDWPAPDAAGRTAPKPKEATHVPAAAPALAPSVAPESAPGP